MRTTVNLFLATASLYLQGHRCHWGRRWDTLTRTSKIEVAQIILGFLSTVIGALLMFLRHGTGGSSVVLPLDTTFAASDRLLDAWLRFPHWLPLDLLARVYPHQVFGAMLAGGSISLIIAVMEWPLENDPVLDEDVAKARLRRLLAAHCAGHFLSLVFWGMSGALTFLNNYEFYIPAIGALALSVSHCALLIRNVNEYIQACGNSERRQAKLETDKEIKRLQHSFTMQPSLLAPVKTGGLHDGGN